MKLIAESGSTRTEWAIVENDHVIQRAFTEGINPYFQTRREISRSVRLGLPDIFFRKKLEQVYYYGAGCSSNEKKNILGASLVASLRLRFKWKATCSAQPQSVQKRTRHRLYSGNRIELLFLRRKNYCEECKARRIHSGRRRKWSSHGKNVFIRSA